MEAKGFRKGKSIGVFGEDGEVVWTHYRTINEAKRANRQTKYPTIPVKGS